MPTMPRAISTSFWWIMPAMPSLSSSIERDLKRLVLGV